MRILHICLSCFYIDNASYQENELVRQNFSDGNDVLILASTETISNSGHLSYLNPSKYNGSDSATVKRIPYRKILPHKLMRKLRMHPNVYREIEEFLPDTIIFHGACGWELRTVARYARDHPTVKFLIDSHEDANNSAKNFISRELLHKRYYGPILRSAVDAAEAVLCISLETMDFVRDMYRIAPGKLEFFPLGGHPLSDSDYQRERKNWREKLELDAADVMFFQTGKFGKAKRLLTSLRAFAATADPGFRLILSGIIAENEDEPEIRRLIESDDRIRFLGWNSADDMRGLLAACDIYLQPGSQSVSMQNSMCQRCALIVDDVKSHRPFLDGNGYFTRAGTDLGEIFAVISSAKSDIPAMQARSHEIALQMLDYAKLACRISG